MPWITYDPGAPYPQTPLFGRGIEHDGTHTPPAGMASFEVDESVLVHGKRTDDARHYDVTAPDVLAAKAQPVPRPIQEVRDEWLAEGDPLLGTGGRLRHLMSTRLWIHWAPIEQNNVRVGAYGADALAQFEADLAAMLGEYKRVATAIQAAPDEAAVDAAVATINWPLPENP